MSRMPGRGPGPVAVVIGSVSCRARGAFRVSGVSLRRRRREQRDRVAAKGQQAMERAAELRAKAAEARVIDLHEASDFDQTKRTAGMLAGRKEGADQAERGEGPKDPA